jgi:hypothetical protein
MRVHETRKVSQAAVAKNADDNDSNALQFGVTGAGGTGANARHATLNQLASRLGVLALIGQFRKTAVGQVAETCVDGCVSVGESVVSLPRK